MLTWQVDGISHREFLMGERNAGLQRLLESNPTQWIFK